MYLFKQKNHFFLYKYSKFHDTRPIHMCYSVNKEMG